MTLRTAALAAMIASMGLGLQNCGGADCDSPDMLAQKASFSIISDNFGTLNNVPFDATSVSVSVTFNAQVTSLTAANIIISPDSALLDSFETQDGLTWTFDVSDLTPGQEYELEFAGVDGSGNPRIPDATVIEGNFPHINDADTLCPASFPNPNTNRGAWQKSFTVGVCNDFELGVGNGRTYGGTVAPFAFRLHNTEDASDAGEDARNIATLDLSINGADVVDLGPLAEAGTCSDSTGYGLSMTVAIHNNGSCDWVISDSDRLIVSLMRQEDDKDSYVELSIDGTVPQNIAGRDQSEGAIAVVINDLTPGQAGGTLLAGQSFTETFTYQLFNTEGTLGEGCPSESVLDADQIDPTKSYYVEVWLAGTTVQNNALVLAQLSQDGTFPPTSTAQIENLFDKSVQTASFDLYNSDAFNAWIRVNDETATENFADVMCSVFVSNDADGDPFYADSLLAGGTTPNLANIAITDNATLSEFFFGAGITDRFDVLNVDSYDESYSADASQMSTYLLANSHTMEFEDVQASWGLVGNQIPGLTFVLLGPLGHHFNEAGDQTKSPINGGANNGSTYHGDFETGNFVGRFKFAQGNNYWMRCSPGAGFLGSGGDESPTIDAFPVDGIDYVVSIDSEVDSAAVSNVPPALPTVEAPTVTSSRYICRSTTDMPVIIDATGDPCSSGTRTVVTDTTIVIDSAGNDTINAQFTTSSDLHWYKLEVPGA